MGLTAITFDYGGTLDGEASHWLDRFVALYAEAGVALPFENVKRAFYHADDASYADPRVAEMSLAELMDFHIAVQLRELGIGDRSLHQQLHEQFVERSNVALAASREVLQQLASRFRIGVISNFYGNVGRILTDAGYDRLLTSVIDSHRVGVSKPDPRIFALTIDALGTSASETLHVGDHYARDVVAARSAGLRAAWLVGERTTDPPTPPTDHVRIRRLSDLLQHEELGA